MANLVLNKYADANSYVFPYTAAKAVDGVLTPLSRWVGSTPLPPSGTPQPNWLRVDLGAFYWVNRWVVKQMGAVGWSPNDNLTDYKLQGSLDNATWFDLDSVTNNSANSTDRAFAPKKTRWVRVYITKGLRCNTNFASIVDLEVYDAPPTDSTLSSLVVSSGSVNVALTPAFLRTTTAYTSSVGYDTGSVTVTPTSTDPNATVAVNGVNVPRGQASAPITLTAGAVTPISVVVTPTIGDPQTYTVNVTRASSPYLSDILIKSGRATLTLSPTFSKSTLQYSSSTSPTPSLLVTATVEFPSGSTLTIQGNPAISGTAVSVPVNSGSNQINITVTSTVGTDSRNYVCNITVG